LKNLHNLKWYDMSFKLSSLSNIFLCGLIWDKLPQVTKHFLGQFFAFNTPKKRYGITTTICIRLIHNRSTHGENA
jgi:hypothetical protein